LKELYKINDKKISVVPHGISIKNSSTPCACLGMLTSLIEGKRIILYFGFLSKRKGVEYLLRAFRTVTINCSDCILIIAGDSLPKHGESYRAKLELLKHNLGLGDKVLFTGFLENECVDYLFSKATIFVLPYTFSPSASGPLSTAIQNGLPTIATEIGYFKSFLTNNFDALLVPPCDDESLANAILELLTNEELAHKLSKNIIRKAEQNTWQNVSKMTLDVYSTLIQGV
jgi:glycosyltransferase involved in cell wall biosynthesis